MAEQAHHLDEVGRLAALLFDGGLNLEDRRRLEQMLSSDEESLSYYENYVEIHSLLHWHHGLAEKCETGYLQSYPPCDSCLPVSTFPAIVLFDGAIDKATSYFSSGWPVAYLMATVIFGIGLLIGSHVYVSQPVQIARQSILPSAFGRGAGGEGSDSVTHSRPTVARITGMVDCKWEEGAGTENQKSKITNQKSPVALGDQFALASGLMEIAYDTGAKVILQGPVTYEVESKDGGFLSLGKLTAKLDKRSEPANQKSEIRNQKLFAVRTPTATITDLGTEFGVEVQNSGCTSAHVFLGVVEVQPAGSGVTSVSRAVRLSQDESIRIRRRQNGEGVDVQRGKADAGTFVRVEQFVKLTDEPMPGALRRWQAYSRQLRKDPSLVAYYPFEAVGNDSFIMLPNVTAEGDNLDGRIDRALWTSGRFPGKVALRFRGPDSGDKVQLLAHDRFNCTAAFSVAVWFKVEQVAARDQALVAKGEDSWWLQQHVNTNRLAFNTNHDVPDVLHPRLIDRTIGHTDIVDGRWHLAAAVYEPVGKTAHKLLYIDGRVDAENEATAPLHKNSKPVWLAPNGMGITFQFQGLIDEVAIFARAMSAEEVAAMFQAGNPAESRARNAQAEAQGKVPSHNR